MRQENQKVNIINVGTMPAPSPSYNELKVVKEHVFDKCGFALSRLELNLESAEYGACSFRLNKKSILFRVSKITPTKTGQFVTIWKRKDGGVIEPFEASDDIDFLVIASRRGEHVGQFVFPKSVISQKGITSTNGKGGKRGIRVYPPWDVATSQQAVKTQSWQTKYFMTIDEGKEPNRELITKLFFGVSEMD